MYQLPEISELREMRLKLGWNQSELARKAKVSRALIQKMEAGVVRAQRERNNPDPDQKVRRRMNVPNYDDVKRIVECLAKGLTERFEKYEGIPIGKICTWDVKWVDMRHPIERARELMLGGKLSQLPVFDKEELRGRLAWESLLGFQAGDGGNAEVWHHRIMDHPEIIGSLHPCVAEWVLAQDLVRVVEREKAILVMRKGKIEGIATEDDFIGLLSQEAIEE